MLPIALNFGARAANFIFPKATAAVTQTVYKAAGPLLGASAGAVLHEPISRLASNHLTRGQNPASVHSKVRTAPPPQVEVTELPITRPPSSGDDLIGYGGDDVDFSAAELKGKYALNESVLSSRPDGYHVVDPGLGSVPQLVPTGPAPEDFFFLKENQLIESIKSSLHGTYQWIKQDWINWQYARNRPDFKRTIETQGWGAVATDSLITIEESKALLQHLKTLPEFRPGQLNNRYYPTGFHYSPQPRLDLGPEHSATLRKWADGVERLATEAMGEQMVVALIFIDKNGRFSKKINIDGVNESQDTVSDRPDPVQGGTNASSPNQFYFENPLLRRLFPFMKKHPADWIPDDFAAHYDDASFRAMFSPSGHPLWLYPNIKVPPGAAKQRGDIDYIKNSELGINPLIPRAHDTVFFTGGSHPKKALHSSPLDFFATGNPLDDRYSLFAEIQTAEELNAPISRLFQD